MLAGLLPLAAPCWAQESQKSPTAVASDMVAGDAAQEGESAGSSLVNTGVMIGAIHVDGAENLDQKAMMQVIQPFIGHQMRESDMQDLLSVVSGVARAKGYVFAHSSIPNQKLAAGVLHIKLDLGRIDQIQLGGIVSPAVQAVLSPLIGKPARQAEMERQLMLAGDLPGISIGRTDYRRVRGLGVLTVQVSRKPMAYQAYADNRGNSAIGPLRLTLGYDMNGLFGEERLSLSGQVQITPAHLSELASSSLRLAMQLDNAGTEIALSGNISRSRPQGRISPFGITGQVRYLGLAINRPLLRSRKASLWLGASLDYFAIDQWQVQNQILEDRVVLAGLSINGYMPMLSGRLRGGLGVTHSLGIFGATQVGDFMASRPGAGAGATILTGWANWQGGLIGPITAKLAISGQMASDPLPAVSQIGIGGPNFGRAFDYAERTGDEGLLGSGELQYNPIVNGNGLLRSAQFYGFADAGHVTNKQNNFGTGNLYSAGLGSRLTLPQNLKLGLEMAWPLNDVRYETGDKTPRLSASLGASF